MSMSQPTLPTYQASTDERPLEEFIDNWKKKSRIDAQYDRMKRILFASNRRPTDYKPSDFFPPIPDSELASDSEEITIEKSDNKPRKSLSKRKLDYERCEEPVENEKQRRQSVLNESTNLAPLKSLSPIIASPSKTTRTVLKLRRESLIEQIQKQQDCEKLSSTINNLKSPSSSKTPAKQAFNDSLRRKSSNLSLMTNNVDLMNEHPLDGNDKVVDGSKEIIESLNKEVEEDEDIFKPPTPPPVIHKSPKSSITITKRRSNEPVREIDIELTNGSNKPKILNQTKSILKQNESINDDQNELLNVQSNKFIKRTSFGNSISSNKTINSTVVNSSASVLFKPKRSNKNSKQLPPPPVPLFNKSIDDETEQDERATQSKAKKKKFTKTKEAMNKNNKKVDEPEQAPPATVEEPVEPVHEISLRELEDKQEKENIEPKKKETRSKSKQKSPKKKLLKSPKKKVQQKSQPKKPLKEVKNQDGYFGNNKTVPLNKNQVVEQPLDDENLPLALRRSKRVKLDKYSQPVYAYETIQDYNGNKCIVQTLVGTKDKLDVKIKQELRKINHLFSPVKKTSKKTSRVKKDPKQKDIRLMIQEKKKKEIKDVNNNENNEEMPFENDHVDTIEDRHEPIELAPVPSNNSLNVTDLNLENCINNSQVNKSQEMVYLNQDDEETQELYLYFYHKNLEKKNYEFCSEGVYICPITIQTGVVRIDSNQSTRTNNHTSDISYVVQRGNCIFSINGTVSLHSEKDVITIPANQPYKIKNCTQNDYTYLYFRFDK